MEKPTSEKSAGAYRTISEVAADLDLPQHVLRFWETRFPQVRPLKRAGGRRFYRPADVAVLRDIRARLYDEGYTIKGVQRLLRERGGGRQQAGERLAEEPLAADAGVINHLPAGDADGADEAVAAAAPAFDAAVASPDSAQKSLAESHASRSAPEDGLADLRGALALIEDCERILRAALAAGDGDGKRLRPGGAAL